MFDNDHGQFNHLIPILGAALDDADLEHLKQHFVALSKEPVKKLAEDEHRVHVIDIALRDIADARGDVDAFVAQYDPARRKDSRIAAEIVERLLAAGLQKNDNRFANESGAALLPNGQALKRNGSPWPSKN